VLGVVARAKEALANGRKNRGDTLSPNSGDALKLLLIYPRPGNANWVKATISAAHAGGTEFTRVVNFEAASRKLRHTKFDAIITDGAVADFTTAATSQRFFDAFADVPVVVMAQSDDDAAALEMIKHGAQDYFVKDKSDGAFILKSIRYAIDLKRADQHVNYLSHHDKLTGLANRELFQDRLAQAVNRTERIDGLLALLFLDLDRFKSINDTLGYGAGDEILLAVSRRLETCVRKADTIARLGDDEFTVIIENVGNAFDAELVCRKIINALEQPFDVRDQEIYVTASIGATFYPADATDPSVLIQNADVAMHRAKDSGRNKYHLFTADLSSRAVERRSIESALRHAIERDELFLCYQPKISLQTAEVLAVEALLRWQHPHRGLISPAEFIPAAEDTGLIVPIGEWVLKQACADAIRWEGLGIENVKVAVNLSARQFSQGNLVNVVNDVLGSLNFDPNRLELEITESLLMDDAHASEIALHELKSLGLAIYLDDFGTGYSSLAYLKKFPIDALKIDRSFIRDIPNDEDDVAIARAIIALGQALRLKVVAEGVETQDQLDFLLNEGCDEVQGFKFSKPLVFDDFIAWASARRRSGPEVFDPVAPLLI